MSDLFLKAFVAAGFSRDEGQFAIKSLSAYVHGTPFALYRQTKIHETASERPDSRITMRTPSINHGELAYSIDTAATVFALAFAAEVQAFGFGESQWDQVWTRASGSLRQALSHILESQS